MTSQLTLHELVRRGVQLAPHEAVAIAQQLIVSIDTDPRPADPLGPPSLDTVDLAADGSVVCRSSVSVPAVLEIALLLDALLPKGGAGGAGGAGGLRYAIARALMAVDAPPFASIAEFSEVLARYEQGDRRTTLRALYARATRHSRPSRAPADERRRGGPSVAALRHELRNADESLFRLLQTNPDARVDPVVAPAIEDRTDDRATVSRADESDSDAWLVIREPVVDIADRAQPPLRLLTEPLPRRRVPRRSLAVLAALLVSMAGGYLAVRQHQAGPIADANGSRSAAARVVNGPSPFDTRNAASTSPAPRALAEQRPSQPAVAVASRSEASPSVAPTSPSTPAPTAVAVGVQGPRPTPDRESSAWIARLPNARYAVQGSDFNHRDLQVLTIADTGGRSTNLQPSPDGRLVAFDSERDGERGVYLANRAGEDVRRISGTGFAAVPSWSPDSRTLAFLRSETDRPHIVNLWLFDVGGGTMRRLTAFRSGETTGAAWFAGGRRVAYAHDGRIIVHGLDSRDLRGSIREYASPVPRRSVGDLAVSPDERRVIFRVGGSGAWLLDLDDGSMRCVLTDPTAESFAWSADGRRVAYYSRRDDEWGVWIMAAQS